MREFISPDIEVMDDIVLEPVYAASGGTYIKKEGDPDIYTQFKGHNSGSHSELALIVVNPGKAGECIVIDFVCKGCRLDYVKDAGGIGISGVCENGFTATRRGHFNANDRIELNIQVVVKDSPYHGAVGKSGDYVPTTFFCSGYQIF